MRFLAVLMALGVIWFSFSQPSGKTEAAPPPLPKPAATTVHYSDEWTERKYNPSSGALGAYQEAVEPIDLRIGTANALLTCNLRSIAWYRSETEVLEAARREPGIQALWARLNEQERGEAQRFDHVVVDGKVRFLLGESKDNCESLQQLGRGQF